jgi:hypothetical protein
VPRSVAASLLVSRPFCRAAQDPHQRAKLLDKLKATAATLQEVVTVRQAVCVGGSCRLFVPPLALPRPASMHAGRLPGDCHHPAPHHVTHRPLHPTPPNARARTHTRAQDPAKRQEVHDQLAATTHKLLQAAQAPAPAGAPAAAAAPAAAPAATVSATHVCPRPA